NGIPDPADFFAELPPIQDPIPETISDPQLRSRWKHEELSSRRELYLLVKLGHWLAKLPIRVSAVANTIVSYVRAREKYPSPAWFRWARYLFWQVSIVISLVLHVLRVPARFPDYKFQEWTQNGILPSWLSRTRNAILRLLTLRDLTWTGLLFRIPVLFLAALCASRFAASFFYASRVPGESWITKGLHLAAALSMAGVALYLCCSWLFVKGRTVVTVVARVW